MIKNFTKDFLAIQPYDEKSDKLQCLECGQWFDRISHMHLIKKHGITVYEYKERYGINKWEALINKKLKLITREIGMEYGRKNIIPAKKGTQLMKGRTNPRREQTLIKRHSQMKEMAAIVKKQWESGLMEEEREKRRERAKANWKNNIKRREELRLRKQNDFKDPIYKNKIIKNLKQFKNE